VAILGRCLSGYDGDRRVRSDFVFETPVSLKKCRPVFDSSRRQEIRDALWLFLSVAYGCTGQEIAEVCRDAARHRAHICRELQRIRTEALESHEKAG